MARFIKGDLVVVPFPLSDASGSKRRPAIVVASWPYKTRQSTGRDYLLCIVSTQAVEDGSAFELFPADMTEENLNRQSFVRPAYLFGASEAIILYKAGHVDEIVSSRIRMAIQQLLT